MLAFFDKVAYVIDEVLWQCCDTPIYYKYVDDGYFIIRNNYNHNWTSDYNRNSRNKSKSSQKIILFSSKIEQDFLFEFLNF